ncbi:assimilatory sulfite reductase (NADPH) hemoprotein subunit [Radiobacillus deserti]|uniref:Sulfite reductase [NADPH] hemoprotein beta-component n=1 Tax=Radiobacillus deserti TaxID=2594883 RepID=A0A516KHM0_9BACI|nr:assimilatory sulfite reductase (NADPH) hemoprotein subunit [Radiobacillus deserti]QDP40882.1 assimilatory sulfite reductase (NADPH) hemoprotein subunit [Radiobacillus deserti]
MTKKFPFEAGPPSEMEKIKEDSNYLRGQLVESFANQITAGIPDEDSKLLKFHGSYMQDDRDIRHERKKQMLEPAYQFMLRVRLPGGVATPEQWLKLDQLSDQYGNRTIKLTTRQTFQLHGILKWNMKPTLQHIHQVLLDTIAACGDVNRNVMSVSNPFQSDIHAEVHKSAQQISAHLLPKTKAYHEIWLDGDKLIDSREEEEPIYGNLYLPRKFKIGIAVPPSNDIDVYSQDLGFIAIMEHDKLVGYNVTIGGGMGSTHGDTTTYPQIGRVIGFCSKDKAVEVAEKIVTIQRDYGNRSSRKHARFKYTVDRLGTEWVLEELNRRLGWELGPSRPYKFDHNGDRYGWVKGDGKWHLTLFIQNGRILDTETYKLKTAIREIAGVHQGDFRLTANQNLIISNVTDQMMPQIERLVEQYGLMDGKENSALRRNSMACVAFPTCGLAMAESERYLPTLIDKLEILLDEAGLREEEITIRMTGCPNGCARPALAEIGFIGKAPGKYNLYLGASFHGDRLNKLYKENIGEDEILQTLRPILQAYAKERYAKERFGDFVIRAGYVAEVTSGLDFHTDPVEFEK